MESTFYSKKWYVLEGTPPITRSGWEVTNRYGTKESYWFETKEWAEFCANHLNRLEDIANPKYEPIKLSISDGSSTYAFATHEKSGWYVELSKDFKYYPPKSGVPNAFHRKMQELCFGFKWSKDK